MSYDFYTEFWDDRRNGVNFRKIEEKVRDTYQRIKLSSLHLITKDNKEWARKNKYEAWLRKKYSNDVIRPNLILLKELGIEKPIYQNIPDFSSSFLLKVRFTLKKPYISQDDENFYIIDNPICKDKVFKVPLVRASSWKGALRWAACKQFVDKLESGEINSKNWKKERSTLIRLFGDEKDNVDSWLNHVIAKKLKLKEEEIEKKLGEYLKDRYYIRESGNRRGRLFFYPTFFDKMGLDVIAPHDRKTKTPARGPIYFETVPEKAGTKNTRGEFYLLYFPFDVLGKEGKETKEEVTQDFEILKDAIPAMLTKYGFGAKTTAGYGIIENEVEFQILSEMERKEKDEKFGFEGSKFEEEMSKMIKSLGEENEQRN
jgi:CRISPR type III-B/RAMP module RAMP protein Cmr6